MNPETQITPTQVPEQKVIKSSPSHLLILFFVILGVAVLSVLGTYYYLLPQLQYSQKYNIYPSNGQSTTQQITPVSSNTQSMEGWKTYTNTKYGYTIKYPTNADIKEYRDTQFVWIDKQIHIDVSKLSTDRGSEVCRGDCSSYNTKSTKTIGTWQITQYAGSLGGIGGNIPQNYIEYEIAHNGLFYSFTVYELKDDAKFVEGRTLSNVPENEIKLLEQMLLTLTFTISTQATDTSNWLVYTHQKISYYPHGSFKLFYPPTWNLKTDKHTDPESMTLNVEKDGVRINVIQGIADGGGCIYPGEPDKEGMVTRYGTYKEIKKGNYTWRVAIAEGNTYYEVCESNSSEKAPFTFANLISVGRINIFPQSKNTPLPAEVYQILEKFEITD